MKRKFYAAMPEMFALRGSDYSAFLKPVSAGEMMAATWEGVGRRLHKAIAKVGADVHEVKYVNRTNVRVTANARSSVQAQSSSRSAVHCGGDD